MVPDGWIKTDLNDYIDIKHGFAFKSEYFRERGDYILLTPGSFYETGGYRDQGSKTKFYEGDIPNGYLLAKNDLLLAMTEQAVGLLGSPLFVPEDDKYLHNQRLGLVKPKDIGNVSVEYLYLIYNSPQIRKQIAEQSTGTKVKHTSPDKLKSVVCLLPPLPEQQKIARILSTWDKAITNTEKRIDNSKQQKKALMQQLLKGKKRFPGFEGEWEEVKLGDVVTKTQLGTTERTKDEVNEDSIPLLKMGNLTWGGFSFEKVELIPKSKVDPELILKSGDFLFNTRNTPALVGKSAVWKSELQEAIFDNNINRLTFTDRVHSEYLCVYLTHGKGKSIVNSLPAGSTSVAAIYWKDLKNIRVKLPSFKEQENIVLVLNNADKEIELLEQQLADLKQEKKALMQQLLTGKRRVKVDEAEVA